MIESSCSKIRVTTSFCILWTIWWISSEFPIHTYPAITTMAMPPQWNQGTIILPAAIDDGIFFFLKFKVGHFTMDKIALSKRNEPQIQFFFTSINSCIYQYRMFSLNSSPLSFPYYYKWYKDHCQLLFNLLEKKLAVSACLLPYGYNRIANNS